MVSFFFFLLDPQGSKPGGGTPTSATAAGTPIKRTIDKQHAASPVKRAKTTVGKKHLIQQHE